MFHSNDPVAGRMMAVSKALSGAPVYLSDAASDFDASVVRPLKAKGITFMDIGNSLYKADLPVAKGITRIAIAR